MNLYFPTTSLNFNDIFATESISPKYFYDKRVFGTTAHYCTELCFDEKFITLFRKLPNFQLVADNNSEYEQYPIIIELSVNEKGSFYKITDDIFCTYNTIYLEKGKFKVFFISEQHKRIVLAKAKLSNESKLVTKYTDDIKVLDTHELTNISCENIKFPYVDLISLDQEIQIDKTFNFFKGFYCLYIFKRFFKEYANFKNKYNANITRYDYIVNAAKLEEVDVSPYNSIINKHLKLIENIQNDYLRELDARHDNIIQKINNVNINNSNQVAINTGYFNESEEKKVFEIIVNTILKNHKSKPGDISDREVVELLKTITSNVLEKIHGSEYVSDLGNIHERIINRDFSIDVSKICTDTMRNLFVFLLKFNKIEELINLITLKNIKNDYLLFAYYGAFYGFSGLSKILTQEYYERYNEFSEIIDTNLECIRGKIRENTCNMPVNVPTIKEKESDYTPKEEIGVDETEKELNSLIKKLTESKRLQGYIKKSIIVINDFNNHVNSQFEFTQDKLKNKSSNINVIYTSNGKKCVITLIHKSNIKDDEKKTFKQKTGVLGIKDNIIRGNYPLYNYHYFEDGKEILLSQNLKEELIDALKRLYVSK